MRKDVESIGDLPIEYKDVALTILVRDEVVRKINKQGEKVRWTHSATT